MGMNLQRMQPKKPRPKIHPAWRGIGCLLTILIPLISFAAADLLIESNLDKIAIPLVLRTVVNTVVFGYIRYFPAKLMLAIIITVSLFALLSIVYSMMYRASGQTGRGPMDAPPSRRKIKKRDR